MGLIMRNGVAYAGSNSIELTQAEYTALEQAGQVQLNTFYCITDADNVLPASDVTYDNTDSGLSANRVQSAVDELSDEVDAIKYYQTQTLTYTGTDNKKTKIELTRYGHTIFIRVINDGSQKVFPTSWTGTGQYIDDGLRFSGEVPMMSISGSMIAVSRMGNTHELRIVSSTGGNQYVEGRAAVYIP